LKNRFLAAPDISDFDPAYLKLGAASAPLCWIKLQAPALPNSRFFKFFEYKISAIGTEFAFEKAA
jgi:hypothetical protein